MPINDIRLESGSTERDASEMVVSSHAKGDKGHRDHRGERGERDRGEQRGGCNLRFMWHSFKSIFNVLSCVNL